MRDIRRTGGGQEKEWMGCFLDDLRAFGINADQWTTAAQDEGEWRKTAEHFMAKWIAAEEASAGLRHAVVCPNVTGRTKERIAGSKQTCGGSRALVDQPQFADVTTFFIEDAALRSIVLRYADAPIATRFIFHFFL